MSSEGTGEFSSYVLHLLTSPVFLLGTIFQVWMLIDAVRR
jgi:hypothetical protein